MYIAAIAGRKIAVEIVNLREIEKQRDFSLEDNVGYGIFLITPSVNGP